MMASCPVLAEPFADLLRLLAFGLRSRLRSPPKISSCAKQLAFYKETRQDHDDSTINALDACVAQSLV